jgi:membrane protein
MEIQETRKGSRQEDRFAEEKAVKWLIDTWKKTRSSCKRTAGRVYNLPVVHPILSVTGKTARGFYKDDCHIMAAAISFFAILSLIPFLLLLISIVGFVLSYLGHEYASQEELFAHVSTYVRAVVPFLTDDVMQRLSGIVSNRGAYGLTGLVFLFVTAGLVFRTLELAFARVFHTRRRRSVVKSQLLFVVFLLALGLVFLAVHYFGVLSSTFYSARDVNFSQRWQNFLSDNAFLRFGVTLLTATTVFIILLKYFSKERVKLKYALAGGVLFSLLWMLAIQIFGYYLTHVARFSLIYGSLATLAIIVVWIFYSACILLLCTEFTSVLQHRAASKLISTAGESPSGK